MISKEEEKLRASRYIPRFESFGFTKKGSVLMDVPLTVVLSGRWADETWNTATMASVSIHRRP